MKKQDKAKDECKKIEKELEEKKTVLKFIKSSAIYYNEYAKATGIKPFYEDVKAQGERVIKIMTKDIKKMEKEYLKEKMLKELSKEGMVTNCFKPQKERKAKEKEREN